MTKPLLQCWCGCYSSNLYIPGSRTACQPHLWVCRQVLRVTHILNTFLFFKWFPSLSVKNMSDKSLSLHSLYFQKKSTQWRQWYWLSIFPLTTSLLIKWCYPWISEQNLGVDSWREHGFWLLCTVQMTIGKGIIIIYCTYLVHLLSSLKQSGVPYCNLGCLNFFSKLFPLSFQHKNITWKKLNFNRIISSLIAI